MKLLRLSWLEKRAAMVEAAPDEAARRDLALPRRQELEARHPEAFLSADEMRALPHGYGGAPNLRLIAISHGWVRSSLESHAQAAPIPDAADPLAPQLTPEHPDPRAEQLVAFVKQVRSERSMFPGGPADSCRCCLEWACVIASPEIRVVAAANPLRACTLLCCPLLMGSSQGWLCGCIPVDGTGCCHSMRAFPRGEAGVFYECAARPCPPARGPTRAPPASRAPTHPLRACARAQLRQPVAKGRRRPAHAGGTGSLWCAQPTRLHALASACAHALARAHAQAAPSTQWEAGMRIIERPRSAWVSCQPAGTA